ncbi:MAG: hypothetical protein J6R88_03590 [Clostridia bacterium]|nr:hypothetical protein [Clostridia bacterium]
MKVSKAVTELMEGFKEYNPVNIEYGKDQIVGFPNDINGCDLVVYVKEKELTLTYGYHHAHFDSDDTNSCIIHGVKLLSGEYASVEYFSGDNDLFGGARPSSTCNFNKLSVGITVESKALYLPQNSSPR